MRKNHHFCDLASLVSERQKAIEKHGLGRRIPVYIPLPWIALTPQVRRRIDPDWIKTLAHLIIESNGCENPPIVWMNSKNGFVNYLKWIEGIWRREQSTDLYFSVNDGDGKTIIEEISGAVPSAETLFCDGCLETDFFFPVVAGGCRTRAYIYIWEHGCDKCIEEYGKEDPGVCFVRHFGSEFVKVQLSVGDNPEEMLSDMFLENNYQAPDREDLADGLALFYLFVCQAQGKLSFKKFTEKYAPVSPDAVGESLRWANLPDFVRERVEEKKLQFGAAIQLARLQEEGFSDGDLRNYIVEITRERWNVDRTREEITRVIRTRQGDRQLTNADDLMSLMESSQDKIGRRLKYRKVICAKMLPYVQQALAYLWQVNALYTDGLIGTDDSIYSEESLRRPLITLFERAREVTQLTKALTPKEKEDGTRDLDDAIQALKDADGRQE